MTTLDSPERLHGLDAVRGFALLMGVVLHTTMSFLPGPQIWVVADSSRSIALSVSFFVIHMLRMSVFFFIAGYFARLAHERLGTRQFVLDRTRRIAVPLVLGWPVVYGAIVVVMYAAWGFTRPAFLPALTPATFPLAHLWFLYVLLIFYVAALVVHGAVTWMDGKARIRRVVDAVMRAVFGPWAVFVLAIPVAVALYRHPYWVMWFGIPTPDSSLYPHASALLAYGTLFGIGWLVQRQHAVILPRLERLWAWHIAIAVVATLVCMRMVGPTPLLMPTPMGSFKLWYAVAYAVGTWGWTLGLIGAGLRFLNAYSARRRYLADASYWIYIAHLPLVIALQLLVSNRGWPWPLKMLAIFAVAMALLLLSYHYLVRPTFIGATLNGRRYPRR